MVLSCFEFFRRLFVELVLVFAGVCVRALKDPVVSVMYSPHLFSPGSKEVFAGAILCLQLT